MNTCWENGELSPNAVRTVQYQRGWSVRTRRRISVLVANLALTGLFLAMSATAAQADDWKKEYTVSGTPDVHVETNDAQIRVSSAETSTVQVHVTTENLQIAPNKVRITEHQQG